MSKIKHEICRDNGLCRICQIPFPCEFSIGNFEHGFVGDHSNRTIKWSEIEQRSAERCVNIAEANKTVEVRSKSSTTLTEIQKLVKEAGFWQDQSVRERENLIKLAMKTDSLQKDKIEILSILNALLDMCFEQTNCPDCLVVYKQREKCKPKCRVNKAVVFLSKRASHAK